MIDLDRFADEFGLDLGERNPEPARPSPPLSPVAAAARDDLVHHLAAARALIEMAESVLQNTPENDAAFDAIDSSMAQRFAQANAALERFRLLRSCHGAA